MTILFTRVMLVFLFILATSVCAEDRHGENIAVLESAVIRKDVLEWISRFYPEPDEIDPVEQYGDAVLPVVTTLLSKPEEISSHQVDGALAILGANNKPYPQAARAIEPYLFTPTWQTRRRALLALAAVGSKHELPIFVTMLYDSRDSVRYQAVMAIGKFGEKSSLTAFAIWRAQATASDEHRPDAEKWFDGSIRNAIDEASTMIRNRIAKEELERSQLPQNKAK